MRIATARQGAQCCLAARQPCFFVTPRLFRHAKPEFSAPQKPRLLSAPIALSNNRRLVSGPGAATGYFGGAREGLGKGDLGCGRPAFGRRRLSRRTWLRRRRQRPCRCQRLSDWHFQASLDGWAPSLNVGMGIRTLPVLPVEANIFQLLPLLEGYVPVSAAAYNENFIVGASLFWVRLGASKAVRDTFGANAGLTINETSVAAYGGVRLPTASDWRVYATLGARYFDINGSVELQGPFVGFSRSASQGRDWVDPFVGVKARHRIDDKWFIDFEANAGGYHGSAAALGFGAVGYKWNQCLERGGLSPIL